MTMATPMPNAAESVVKHQTQTKHPSSTGSGNGTTASSSFCVSKYVQRCRSNYTAIVSVLLLCVLIAPLVQFGIIKPPQHTHIEIGANAIVYVNNRVDSTNGDCTFVESTQCNFRAALSSYQDEINVTIVLVHGTHTFGVGLGQVANVSGDIQITGDGFGNVILDGDGNCGRLLSVVGDGDGKRVGGGGADTFANNNTNSSKANSRNANSSKANSGKTSSSKKVTHLTISNNITFKNFDTTRGGGGGGGSCRGLRDDELHQRRVDQKKLGESFTARLLSVMMTSTWASLALATLLIVAIAAMVQLVCAFKVGYYATWVVAKAQVWVLKWRLCALGVLEVPAVAVVAAVLIRVVMAAMMHVDPVSADSGGFMSIGAGEAYTAESDTTFDAGSSVDDKGGVFAVSAGGELTVGNGCVLSNNKAYNGAAIYVTDDGSVVEIGDDVLFHKNSATVSESLSCVAGKCITHRH